MKKLAGKFAFDSSQAEETSAGIHGTPNINVADGLMNIKCCGFQSWDDATVISHLKTSDESATERIATALNLASRPIPKGMTIMFGFEASQIQVSAGSGSVIKSEAFKF